MDIGIDGLFLETTGTEIDYFDSGFVGLLEQDVLGLKVGMDNLVFVEEVDCVENLEGHATDEFQGKTEVTVTFY